MVIVVCFVGGMLYYSMNVLWPQQSQAFFLSPEDVIMRGVYAIIFSCGTWGESFQSYLSFVRCICVRLTISLGHGFSGWTHHCVCLFPPPS